MRRHQSSRFCVSAQGASWAVLAGLLAIGASASAIANLLGGDEPLAPELAFVPDIEKIDEQSISVKFFIEPGYYLYRDKLDFSVDDVVSAQTETDIGSISALIEGGANNAEILPVTLSAPAYSEAQLMHDDYFGEQAVFRDSASISIPYTVTGNVSEFTLAIKYQGCADIGLCYPPTTALLQVEVPQMVSQAQVNSSPLPVNTAPGRSSERLSGLLKSETGNDELLPPELAYLPQLLSATTQQIAVRWQIEDGYYLYRDKLSFALEPANGLSVNSAEISPGVSEYDDFFGQVEVLRHTAEAMIGLTGTLERADQTDAVLVINYQGCADIGVCFPPSQARLPLSYSIGNAATQLAESSPAIAVGKISSSDGGSGWQGANKTRVAASQQPDPATQTAQSEQDRLFGMLGTNSLWLNVATFFGLGLLLAFTPCVLPMVPILSSLIVGQGKSMTTAKAFQLSLVYVLVMATTYAIVGVIIGLSGYNVQALLQKPWVLTSIALLFVALSLSMFGFYELRLPASLQARLTQWSNRQGGGQVGGVAAMGFVSTLIVGPCVTAPLAGALIYIAKTGDALIGGAALFALGLGMGAPLLLIGTSAGKLLPRAGAWMTTVNYIFGILLLGMAVYMMSRFLPATVTMSLFGILAVMSGVYLGATDSMSRDCSGWQRFSKGTGILVALYGVTLLVGALAGGHSYTTPLKALVATGSSQSDSVQSHALPFEFVKGVDGLQQVLAQAKTDNRPVMLDFYADWCISCKEMEAFTFSDERVQEQLRDAVVVQADVTANDAADQALLKKFDLFGPPGIIFYDHTGRELRAARIVGFMNADDFSTHVQRFIGQSEPLAQNQRR